MPSKKRRPEAVPEASLFVVDVTSIFPQALFEVEHFIFDAL